MKTVTILVTAVIALFFCFATSAQDTNSGLAINIAAFENNTNVIWGMETNGVRAGLEIIKSGHNGAGYAKASECIVYFQNLTTNLIANKSVSFRIRCRVGFYDKNWKSIRVTSGIDDSAYSGGQITGLYYKETTQINYFTIPDMFEIQTNEICYLVAYAQAATNQWHGKLTYFDLPPVTNIFSVSTNDLKNRE